MRVCQDDFYKLTDGLSQGTRGIYLSTTMHSDPPFAHIEFIAPLVVGLLCKDHLPESKQS